MYTLNPPTDLVDLHAFWSTVKSLFPLPVKMNIEPTGDIIESTTGVITGTWVGLQTAQMSGEADGKYSAPSGAVVTWVTGTVLDGRKVRGRTFLVPILSTNFDTGGSLEAATIAQIGSAASGLVTAEAGNFVIWHRPRAAAAAINGRPAVTARAGGHALVTGVKVPDLAVVLRSRRD